MNSSTNLSLSTAKRLARHAATHADNDGALLAAAVAAVRATGTHMLARFDAQTRTPDDLQGVVAAIHDNDDASLAVARELLEKARPNAGWVDDELEGGTLPDGEWWVFDAVEGNVNHVHGLPEWGISATLVRDNVPVLTAVHEPVADRLYTAVRGSGSAYVNGVPMRPSTKTELRAAIVTTGQAKPGETPETYRRLGASVASMLNTALVVRMTVPATFELGRVAAGQIEGFWQYSDVRSGLAAGALLVSEAGGVVTDTRGHPWTLASEDFLASAPGVHGEAVRALSLVA
ncbi:MAG: inositol monophosphatase [Acidovorax sp.]